MFDSALGRNTLLKLPILLAFCLTSFTKAQVGQTLWEENFNSFDTAIWNVDLGDGCPDLCGWGNDELQTYQNENVSIEEIPGEPGNFALVLEAKKDNQNNFTSGRVTTKNNLGVKYGMIETRIKVPDNLSKGLWPAAWLLGTNIESDGWPFSGEMDMMEMGHNSGFRAEQEFGFANENNLVGANLIFYDTEACSDQNPTCAASIAFDKYYNELYYDPSNLTDRFLTYRLYWDENYIRFTVEDQSTVQNLYTSPFPIGDRSSAFTKPFYLLLNLAVGGTFTDALNASQVTADFPAKMYVDYSKIKKWNGRGEVFTPEKIMANAGANKQIAVGESIQLNASGSYGPISTYQWSYKGGEVLANSSSHQLTLSEGTYEFELKITDEQGNTDSDTVKITVGNSEIGAVIWEDNFDSFDENNWNVSIGDGCDEGICGWGNEELQSYQEENVYIEEIDGEPGNFALVLEAKNDSVGDLNFTSGKVTTENKVAIQQGVVEVRMKAPDVQDGLWPAAWLLGINHRQVDWPYCGEIDMMEMGHAQSTRQADDYFGPANNFVGANLIWYASGACGPDNPSCAASIAFDKNYSTPYTSSSPLNNRFVTYRMYWSDEQIRLTVVDGSAEYDLYTNPFPISPNEDVFKKPFYFILNLAVGGNFTGQLTDNDISAPLPGKLLIDYVRVKKWKGQGEVSFSQGPLLANAGDEIILEDLDKNGVESVTLDASSSYGPIASYEWSENNVVLSQEQTANVDLGSGIHNIKLLIRDEFGNESEDFVKVDVREILWEENFNEFNTDVWEAEIGDGCDQGLCGWGNDELQSYKQENVYIEAIPGEAENNALVIEAKVENDNQSAFTSARVKSQDQLTLKYGLVETRIKVPDDLSTGLWPAFWLLGNNISEVDWPRSGEIDMMEMGYKQQSLQDEGFENATENEVVGGNIIFYSDEACAPDNPDCAASISFDKYYSRPYRSSSNTLTDRFLTYRMYWDPNEIKLTVVDNGQEFEFYTGPFPLGADAEEFHLPFFFVINLAVGGNFTDALSNNQVTADFPAKMLVDYIRVYKWNGYGEVATQTGIIANAGPDIVKKDENGDGVETVYLDGTSSTHHSGEITSYSWTIDGEEVASSASSQLELPRGTYTAILTIADQNGNQASDELLITISSGGLGPIANAGEDQQIEDDNEDDLVTVTLDGSASEAVAAPLSAYEWFENEVLIASGVNPTIELSTGIHIITLKVTDEDEMSATDEVVITAIDPDNEAPTAVAGEDRSINDEDGDDLIEVTFDGSASFDNDGTIVYYAWRIDETLVSEEVSFVSALSTGVYSVELVVTDNDGAEGSSSFTLSLVDPDNSAPMALAGDDQLVIDTNLDELEKVVLDASLSSDEDGSIEVYRWIENDEVLGTEANIEIELNLGEHIITLEVQDDDGVSSTDQISVIVNQRPISEAGDEQIAIDTDGDAQETVTLDGSQSYDSDGSITAYQWQYNNQTIGSEQQLDYDFAIGAHEVTLAVTDNFGTTAEDSVTVFVSRNSNNAPTANAGDDLEVYADRNSNEITLTLDGSQSSDSDGSIYRYEWIKDNTSVASTASTPITLGIGTHQIELKVTDNEGASASDILTITVLSKTNLALNKSVTTSSQEGAFGGDLAVDGDDQTRWSSLFSDPQFISVDLENIYQINEVVLLWEVASAKSYEIQTSIDNNSWVTIYSTANANGGTEAINLNGQGRFIRLNLLSRNTEYGYSLFEFEVYGELSTDQDENPPTNLSASVTDVGSTNVSFNLSASDDSGSVVYSVVQNGQEQLFSGTSSQHINATYTGLNPETSYNFNISVSDVYGNTSSEVVNLSATTTENQNNSCAGQSDVASQGNFEIGYTYSFVTEGNDVKVEFELLDSKTDLIAYLWRETPFSESPMTALGGQKFTATIANQTLGSEISYACKFAFPGGLAVTEYIKYTIGDNCSSASDDDDNDGIPNGEDLCPNTPEGVDVDFNGCEVFTLPADTFVVKSSSVTCIGESNGSISIEATNSNYSYTYSIDDESAQPLSGNTILIENLSPATYSVCLGVEGQPNYKRCYTVTIEEPLPLQVSSKLNEDLNGLDLEISGPSSYQVELNGEKFTSFDTRLSLKLNKGLNRIKIYTDLDCQGVYYKELFVSEKVVLFPNPATEEVNIFVAGSDQEVKVRINSIVGQSLYDQTIKVPFSRVINLNLGLFKEGIYLIRISGETVEQTQKLIIK